MINRTLIRLKVVQMLYSYLLTRSEFRLLPPPEKQSRDNRSAYELYLDLILFILELSGYSVSNSLRNPLSGIATKKQLSATKMAKSLSTDSDIREVILKATSSVDAFTPAIAETYEAIVSSAAFVDYCKKKNPEIADDVEFWRAIVETILAKNNAVVNAARSVDGFTQIGFDKAIEMVVETLNNYSDTKSTLFNAKRNLKISLNKAYELYHAMFLLMAEITNEQRSRIESAKEKFVPTAEDLNPNTRFIDNRFIAAVESSDALKVYLKDNPISWEGDYFLVKQLLDEVLASDILSNYMEGPEPDFAADCELWRKLLRHVILPSDALAEALEQKSVYWNDDLDIMSTFVAKTIKQWASAGNDSPGFLPMYKDDEDASFGEQLFTDAVANRELYRGYIDRFIDTDQWDPDRLALMDVVIMTVMIAELINFPNIPIAVTFNEYIEIANRYSTPKSGQFINGVLYNVVRALNEEGKILK